MSYLKFFLFVGVCIGGYYKLFSPWWFILVIITNLVLDGIIKNSAILFIQGLVALVIAGILYFCSMSPWWMILTTFIVACFELKNSKDYQLNRKHFLRDRYFLRGLIISVFAFIVIYVTTGLWWLLLGPIVCFTVDSWLLAMTGRSFFFARMRHDENGNVYWLGQKDIEVINNYDDLDK